MRGRTSATAVRVAAEQAGDRRGRRVDPPLGVALDEANDAGFAEDISRLIGDHDIDAVSYSCNRDGGSSSTSTRRERIMPAADVRAMPKNTAVLMATGIRPALIRLLPWYEGRATEQITAAEKRAATGLRGRAGGSAPAPVAVGEGSQ